MKRLQASLRDVAAKTWKENRLYYKVGSVFKGCHQCGDVEEDEEGKRKRYTSGFDVVRSYDPQGIGWTWWCRTCGAKDLECWEPDMAGMVEAELGKPPYRGPRDVMAQHKYALRKELMKLNPRVPRPKAPSRAAEIKVLENELAKLMEMIKERIKV